MYTLQSIALPTELRSGTAKRRQHYKPQSEATSTHKKRPKTHTNHMRHDTQLKHTLTKQYTSQNTLALQELISQSHSFTTLIQIHIPPSTTMITKTTAKEKTTKRPGDKMMDQVYSKWTLDSKRRRRKRVREEDGQR